MPRQARCAPGGICYHVVDRGNARAAVYLDEVDYVTFLDLMARACERLPMRLLAYCLMPNHLHLALWPFGDGDLGQWMHWVLTAHVNRHRKRHSTTGHIWQGRYKAFPIQQDHHLLTVLRYVERNPLRAGLVERAEAWRWSSLRWWSRQSRPEFLVEGPIARPEDWVRRVNEPTTQAELDAIRISVQRSRPFGAEEWVTRTAKTLHMETSLRNPGRQPRLRRQTKLMASA